MAECPTHVQHWPEWRLVREAEERGGAPYVAALAHWSMWRGRWLEARGCGDFGGMVEAELKAERFARTMRNALRWRGVAEAEVLAAIAAHRRVTDEVMRHPQRSFSDAPEPESIAAFVRRLKAKRQRAKLAWLAAMNLHPPA